MIRLQDLKHGLSDADARTMVDWINAEIERDGASCDTDRMAETPLGGSGRSLGSAVPATPAGAQSSGPSKEEGR